MTYERTIYEVLDEGNTEAVVRAVFHAANEADGLGAVTTDEYIAKVSAKIMADRGRIVLDPLGARPAR